jgi:hypothetical protein
VGTFGQGESKRLKESLVAKDVIQGWYELVGSRGLDKGNFAVYLSGREYRILSVLDGCIVFEFRAEK